MEVHGKATLPDFEFNGSSFFLPAPSLLPLVFLYGTLPMFPNLCECLCHSMTVCPSMSPSHVSMSLSLSLPHVSACLAPGLFPHLGSFHLRACLCIHPSCLCLSVSPTPCRVTLETYSCNRSNSNSPPTCAGERESHTTNWKEYFNCSPPLLCPTCHPPMTQLSWLQGPCSCV